MIVNMMHLKIMYGTFYVNQVKRLFAIFLTFGDAEEIIGPFYRYYAAMTEKSPNDNEK